jgi:hypothetical protein
MFYSFLRIQLSQNKRRDMKNEDEIIEKMCAKLGNPDLASLLTNVAWRNVQPILIKVMRDRVARNKPIEILSEYESRPDLYSISKTDQRSLYKFIGYFHDVVPKEYDVVELSPISPIGLNSSLTKVSQDVTLSSIRLSEVVSDPTTALAVQCALQRKKMMPNKERLGMPVNLATATRVLRLQQFDQSKGYLQHFQLLGMCSGGRNGNGYLFGVKYLVDHISIWLDFVQHLQKCGYFFQDIQVKISDVRWVEALIQHLNLDRAVINLHSLDDDFDLFDYFDIQFLKETESVGEIPDNSIRQNGLSSFARDMQSTESVVLKNLRDRYPNIRFCFDFNRKAGLGYYQDLCYHIFATSNTGRKVQLADGGSTNWLARLLSSKKEQMITSGFGAELIHNLFKVT